MPLTDALAFAEFLDRFRKVERVIYANGTDRQENDVEHSYMLAMLAWQICMTEKLSLDIGKVLKYALVHDLVEVYAGDTYFYTTDEKSLEDKQAREEEAAHRIAAEFPGLSDVHEHIAAYERRTDDEARFVYALDKVQPVINIYLDGGRTWRARGVTLDMLREKKTPKVAIDPTIARYWDDLCALIEKHSARLFR